MKFTFIVCIWSNALLNCITMDILSKSAIDIQRIFRGYLYRRNNLPNSILTIRKTLMERKILCSNITTDGRTNSNFDEKLVIDILVLEFGSRIKIPKIRMWFDVAIHDYAHGFLPINIQMVFCRKDCWQILKTKNTTKQ